MATGYKTCRVCGKSYEYCRTNRRTTIFRWQDVACSPEHGAIYFAQIAASREQLDTGAAINNFSESSESENFDVLFEEDFDDDEEELEIEK